MSNRATIQRTVFRDYRNNNEESFGYRIFDDYGQDYRNTLTKEQMELSDAEFFKLVKTFSTQIAESIIEYAIEKGGIFIDSTYYELNGETGEILIVN